MHIDAEGTSAWLPRISTVGITDLTTVRSHRIASVFGSVSHVVQFHSGGELRFAYNSAGKLLELSGEGASITIKPNGEVLFGPCR